jgi:predicted NBD/HSP70 family sugar kinase
MIMASLLKPEVSVGVAAAVGTLVFGIYSQATPTFADMRAVPPGDPNIDGTRKSAAWLAAVAVAGISLLTRDSTVFVVGGGMIIAMDWLTRHASEVNPGTGKVLNLPMKLAPVATNTGDVQVVPSEGVGSY